MDLITIFTIAVALAMDAFSVSISAGIIIEKPNFRHYFRLAFHFGLFQFMMPIIGYFFGAYLENYIKDSFANTFEVKDEQKRLEIFSEKFSWLGNQNHPPDIMIKGGDAIEVKKTQSARSDLALNSSYPKPNIVPYRFRKQMFQGHT